MATSNVAVTPTLLAAAGQNTPVAFAEFAAGLTTGKSLDGATLTKRRADADLRRAGGDSDLLLEDRADARTRDGICDARGRSRSTRRRRHHKSTTGEVRPTVTDGGGSTAA